MSPAPLCFLLLATVLSAAEIPLAPGPHRDLTLKPGPDAVLEVRLGEGHPHFWTAIVPGAYDPARQTVLALDCFAPSGFDSLVLRYRVEGGDMAVAEVRQVSVQRDLAAHRL